LGRRTKGEEGQGRRTKEVERGKGEEGQGARVAEEGGRRGGKRVRN
jgi:hypothetical protein